MSARKDEQRTRLYTHLKALNSNMTANMFEETFQAIWTQVVFNAADRKSVKGKFFPKRTVEFDTLMRQTQDFLDDIVIDLA